MVYLKWEDYLLILVSVVLSLGTGLFQTLRGKKDKTVTKYIMGNGKMAILPVALSMLVSYHSGILMLGYTAEVYLYGMQITMMLVGNIIGDLVSLYLFVPHLSRMEMNSIFQFLEMRYGSRGIRKFGTILSIIIMANYNGTVLAMPAAALKAVAGIDIWMSIVGLMSVVLVYTLIGGFTAVIWTDVLQSLLMFGGILAVIIKGTIDAGGLSETWRTVYDQGRVNLLIFDVDPTRRQAFWSLIIGGFTSSLLSPFLQTTYLRIKANPTAKARRKMYLLSSFLSVSMRFLAGVCGAVMFAYFFNKGCDPLVSKRLDNPNQMMPAMVIEIFQENPGLPGLFMAALFCASLSTLSSVLSGMMSLLWEDIIKPYTKPMSERRGIMINQISGLAFGVVGIGVAFLVSNIQGPVIQIMTTLNACGTGAIMGIFVLGLLVPWANKQGAMVGGMASVLVVAWITIGKMTSSGTRKNPTLELAPIDNCPSSSNVSYTFLYNVNITSTSLYDVKTAIPEEIPTNGPYGLDVLYSLSYHYLETIGIVIVLVVGAVVSRLTGGNADQEVNPELLVPVSERLCCCIPSIVKE